jgi:hypothetical protein
MPRRSANTIGLHPGEGDPDCLGVKIAKCNRLTRHGFEARQEVAPDDSLPLAVRTRHALGSGKSRQP